MKLAARVLGILLAAFLLLTSAADIIGPAASGRMTVTMARFRQNFVPIMAGILLLVNYKRLTGSARKFVYLCSFLAVNLWYSLLMMRLMAGFFTGAKSYHVIPFPLVILTILWGTFWLGVNHHFGQTRRSR